MQLAAEELGYAEDAQRYAAQCARTAAAFHGRHFDSARGCYGAEGAATQTMQAMPLALGMVPAEYEKQVVDYLLADIAAHENHSRRGFLGTTFLAQALAKYHQHDVLLRILTQRDFPSFGRIFAKGSTTITEAWNAHLGIDLASHNHFNLGSVSAWFVNHLVGIQGAAPGMRSLRIAPVFPDGLDFAEGELLTPHGAVRSAWKRQENGNIEFRLEVPVSAEICLPDGWGGLDSEAVEPGVYEWVLSA